MGYNPDWAIEAKVGADEPEATKVDRVQIRQARKPVSGRPRGRVRFLMARPSSAQLADLGVRWQPSSSAISGAGGPASAGSTLPLGAHPTNATAASAHGHRSHGVPRPARPQRTHSSPSGVGTCSRSRAATRSGYLAISPAMLIHAATLRAWESLLSIAVRHAHRRSVDSSSELIMTERYSRSSRSVTVEYTLSPDDARHTGEAPVTQSEDRNGPRPRVAGRGPVAGEGFEPS
jgi:hypothetical protein